MRIIEISLVGETGIGQIVTDERVAYLISPAALEGIRQVISLGASSDHLDRNFENALSSPGIVFAVAETDCNCGYCDHWPPEYRVLRRIAVCGVKPPFTWLCGVRLVVCSREEALKQVKEAEQTAGLRHFQVYRASHVDRDHSQRLQ